MISFEDVESLAKNFLILYPPFENSATRIAIVTEQGQQQSLVLHSLELFSCSNLSAVKIANLKTACTSKYERIFKHPFNQIISWVSRPFQFLQIYNPHAHKCSSFLHKITWALTLNIIHASFTWSKCKKYLKLKIQTYGESGNECFILKFLRAKRM